jgi:hypothetical protein
MLASKNKVESRIVRCFWNDGLLDILAGMGALLIGITWQLGLVPLGAIAPTILIPFWKPLRAKITEPRLGYVELSGVQQRRNKSFLVMAGVLGVVVLVAGIAGYLAIVRGARDSLGDLAAAIPAFLLGLVSLMVAAVTLVHRFVQYAIVFVIFGIAVAELDQEPGWAMIAGGLVIILGGAVTLYYFLARYPKTSDDI